MKSLDFKSIMIAAVLCTAIILPSFLNANCEMMAMIAKKGNYISWVYSEPEDWDDPYDFFQFQRTQSHQGLHNDGYGVIYYKNNTYTINYDRHHPFDPQYQNQAFYLWGEYNNCWYGREWHEPDDFGHRWQDSEEPGELNYEWIPRTGGETEAEFPDDDTADEVMVPIGYSFPFYGINYYSPIINPNGLIGFGEDNQAYSNIQIPSEDAPRPAVFGFWDDLNPVNNNPNGYEGGNVYYEYQSAENRLVVWFDHVKHWQNEQYPFDLTIDFQFILNNNGKIKIQYNSVDGTTPPNSATIGIQKATGLDGLQVAYNEDFVENEFAIEFSTEAYPRPLDIAEDIIMDADNDAVIVLGHDRDRGWTSQDAAGQHPYRFEWNDKTYTFQHNGVQDAKEEMKQYCQAIDLDWFDIDNHPLNWEILGNDIKLIDTVCDTELLFHYIMAHVIEFNGDVIAGLISTLNEQDLCGYNFRDSLYNEDDEVNIVLSDGEALYLFRNYTEYNLYYKEYDGLNEGFIGVKTDDLIPDGTTVQQYSLVEIPREGEIVTYENILTGAKAYSFDPTSEPGWTWLSFDILYPDSDDNVAETFLAPISDIDELDEAKFKPHSPNSNVQTISFYPIQQNLDHPFTSPYGYKFRTWSECHFTVFGERCESTTTFYLAGENEENWIGYFLLETQHVYDAFAGHLDNLTEIRAQHWAVKKLPNGSWPDVPYTISSGDMVIACCVTDVPAFYWNFQESREKYIVPESKDFTFEEEADYIPVFISLDPEDLPSEIGAFVDGECKGATVVQDTSAQICSYILENQGQNLTFEFSYGSRGQNKRIDEYIIYDPETSKTVKGSVQIDIRRDCYYVSFKGKQNETPAVTSIEITNYPNPFNPETKIEYSIPSESKIELSIYNIKGQKVRLLVSGQLSAGKHSVVWEGKDENEKPVGSGLYFYKLRTEDKVLTKKMLLLK